MKLPETLIPVELFIISKCSTTIFIGSNKASITIDAVSKSTQVNLKCLVEFMFLSDAFFFVSWCLVDFYTDFLKTFFTLNTHLMMCVLIRVLHLGLDGI